MGGTNGWARAHGEADSGADTGIRCSTTGSAMLRAIGETALVTKADIRACKTCWSRRRKDAEDAKDAETQDARRKDFGVELVD